MKKTINWLMAMMLLVQLVMPWLVAFAEDEGINPWDYQEFVIAADSSCQPWPENKTVFPDLSDYTPSASTYGYLVEIIDQADSTKKDFVYYGGAENAPYNACADSVEWGVTIPLVWYLWFTIEDWWIYGINPFEFRATKSWTPEENNCKYVLVSNDVSKWLNKWICEIFGNRTDTSSWKGKCDVDIPASLLPQNNYNPVSFDIDAAQLPWVSPENASGYAVEFFPLDLNNTEVGAWELLNVDQGEWIEVNSTIRGFIDNPIYSVLGDSAGTCGLGIDLPDISTSEGVCNPLELLAGLPTLGTALSNFASSLGGIVGDFEGIGTNIGDLISGLQGGTLDPAMLENLVNILTSLNLPDMALLADAFDDLADALDTARPCLSLVGTNVGPTISALRAVADDFQAMDEAMQDLKGALEDLGDGSPADKFCAVGGLAEAVADGIDAMISAHGNWTDLSTALGALGSIPGIGNVGDAILGPVLGQVSEVFGYVIGPMSQVSGPLHTLAGYFAQACPIVKNIEATVGASSGLPQDLSGIFADLPMPPNPENSECSDWVAYQSEVVAYLDGHIASYTALKTRIGQIGGIWGFDATKATAAVDQILGVLNQEKSIIDSIPTGEICNKMEEVIRRYNKAKTFVKALKLDAPELTPPTFEEAYCTREETDISSLIFEMSPFDKANEVRGYLAIVTDANGSQSVYGLPGGANKALTIPANDFGTYTVNIRAIGKDKLIRPNDIPGFPVAGSNWVKLPTHSAGTIIHVVKHLDELQNNPFFGHIATHLLNESENYTVTLEMSDDCEPVVENCEVSSDHPLYNTPGALYDNELTCETPDVPGYECKPVEIEGNEYLVWKCEKIEEEPEIELSVADITITGLRGSAFSRLLGADGMQEGYNYYFVLGNDTFWSIGADGQTHLGTMPATAGTYAGEAGNTYRVCIGELEDKTELSSLALAIEDPEESDENCSPRGNITYIATNPTGWGGGGSWGGSSGGIPQVEEVEEVLEADIPTDKCSILWSDYSDAENAAYQYACENGITTMDPISNARLEDPITRAELAKVLSQYVMSTTDRKPDTSKDCSAFEASIAHYSNDLPNYMKLACQLNIMGVRPDYTPLSDFRPDQYVTRAEFATVFSRILWGNRFEGTDTDWSSKHLQALKAAKILTNDDPSLIEKRSWIFLMIHRSIPEQAAPAADVPAEVEEETTE